MGKANIKISLQEGAGVKHGQAFAPKNFDMRQVSLLDN